MPHTPTATPVQQADPVASTDAADAGRADALVDEDTIVEEISIDGMCGVY